MKANLYIGGEQRGEYFLFTGDLAEAEKAKDLDFDNNLDSNNLDSKQPRLLSRSKITKDLNLTLKGKKMSKYHFTLLEGFDRLDNGHREARPLKEIYLESKVKVVQRLIARLLSNNETLNKWSLWSFKMMTEKASPFIVEYNNDKWTIDGKEATFDQVIELIAILWDDSDDLNNLGFVARIDGKVIATRLGLSYLEAQK